ncbi:MAG: imidazole glycerol phosphate synthase subunit HisH [Spirochaetaceae bacterium]|nr:imidazole glycerol phosphate synthase subunit HisH [Spirochaetaceae bacterium]
MVTGVVDYKAGNLKSIENALKNLNADFIISDDPEKLENCDKLIFPGVGEASSAMRSLSKYGLDQFLKEYVKKGNPLLGICLGAQIILSWSEEGEIACLNIIDGKVQLFDKNMGLKIPQIGWNAVRYAKSHYLFKDIPDNSSFYFVHSYYPNVKKEFTIGECEYGITFTSAISRDNVCAVQFHPEKSGRHGLKLMNNFLKGE